MKGIYISGRPKMDATEGVEKKIQAQLHTFRVTYLCEIEALYEKNRLLDKVMRYLPLFSRQVNFAALKNIEKVDFLYIRKPIIDFNFIHELKKIKRKNNQIVVLLELPTFPYDNEFKKTLRYRCAISKDKIWRKYIDQVVDYIVTYSKDQKIFNVPAININNAADFENIEYKDGKFSRHNVLNMTGIAKFQIYHGYDRLINGIGTYYKNGGKWNINLNLIGDGNESVLNEYKLLVKKYSIEKHVKLFHAMNTEEQNKIFNHTDVAIDTLARFRSGVYYNSTLKGKEYLARGVPIVSGVETELDGKNFNFYHRVAANEEFVNVNSIIKFFENNVLKSDRSDESIIKYIRNYGEQNFSFDKSLKPVIDAIYNFKNGDRKE